MSVTRTTAAEVLRKLEAGDWEALGAIELPTVLWSLIRNLRTGSRFTISSSTTSTSPKARASAPCQRSREMPLKQPK